MLKDKKAGFNFLGPTFIKLIIAAASIILLMTIFVPIYYQSTESGPVSACKKSVELRSAAAVKLGDVGKLATPLACKTVKPKEDINGDRREVKEQIARMMSNCWLMFNEGKQDDLLKDKTDILLKTLGFGESSNKCFLCYNLRTSKDIDSEAIQPKEMFDYMIETKHHKVKKVSYLNYIQKEPGSGSMAILDKIEPNHAYGIVYLSKFKDDSSWSWASSVGAVALVTAGVACFASIGCGVAVVTAGVAGGTLLTAQAYNQYKIAIYEVTENPRATSTVVFDNLKSIEQGGCLVQNV